MDPTPATAYQGLIVGELGDPEGVLAPKISLLWGLYADYAGIPRLQYLRTKIHAIDLLLGSVRTQITFSVQTDVKLNLIELSTNLEALRGHAEGEFQALVRQRRAPAVGDLTTTVGEASPPGTPDANASGYRGDPNARMRGWGPGPW